MSFFTSYAQNCEDVLLWRALGHIKNGFYIDVGANDTEQHSVTKAFYERGWWGINIEPLPLYHAAFMEQRPRDINLQAAAGEASASITLFDVPDVHGWATLDPQIAEMHRAQGKTIIEMPVQVLPLKDICAQYVPGEIHFLKIDVEGFEGAVLRGMDFSRWRPWIVVIEATLPNSRECNHQQWESLILPHAYQFAWFDGLNRYYVAQERQGLAAVLASQPNVFDNFHNVHLVHAWQERDAARAQIEEVTHQCNVIKEAAWKADIHSAAIQTQLDQERQKLEQERQKLEQEYLYQRELHQQFRQHQMQAAQQQRLVELQNDHALEQLARSRAQAAQAENAAALATQQKLQAEHTLHVLQEDLQRVHAWAGDLNALAQDLQNRLQAIHNSSSWRVTAPIRSMISRWQALRNGNLFARAKRALRTQSFKLLRKIFWNQRLREALVPYLRRYPSLLARLTQVNSQMRAEQSAANNHQPAAQALPPALRQVAQEVRHIHADLQRRRSSR